MAPIIAPKMKLLLNSGSYTKIKNGAVSVSEIAKKYNKFFLLPNLSEI